MIRRAILVLCFAVLGLPAGVLACSCSQQTGDFCANLQSADAVFVGTVTTVERDRPVGAAANASTVHPAASNAGDPASAAVIQYHFQVSERFAGPTVAEADIFSGSDDAGCAFNFRKGVQYLVFAQRHDDGRFYSTSCGGTRPATEAIAVLPQLRAWREGKRVASVFGLLRRTDPPFLAAPGNIGKPLAGVVVRLQSEYDRFQTSTDADGAFSFYDVHAGDYHVTAELKNPADISSQSSPGEIPEFQIPDHACHEVNVEALPTGHIRGAVLGPNGKPLPIASLELYRAGTYSNSRPGLWGFQGATGAFDFDHVGPGKYILVFNRPGRLNPNEPFPRAFYPGVSSASEAKPIVLREGQQLLNVTMRLKQGYPTRQVRVRLKWEGQRPSGSVTIQAKADRGENPSAEKISDGVYEIPLLGSGHYTISAYEDILPARLRARRGGNEALNRSCVLPPRIQSTPVAVSGADSEEKDVLLVFSPACSASSSDQAQ